MAGITILMGYLKITRSARIGMTLDTGQPYMLASNLEWKPIMIELFSKTIHPIMTIQTGRTKRQRVRGHKAQIHLTVAPIASIQSERCDVTLMAVITSKRLTVRCKLVTL